MESISYAKILVEKSLAWLKTSQETQSCLSAKDFATLADVVARRENAIQGYIDCLERWIKFLKSTTDLEISEHFLPELLSYSQKNADIELVDALTQVKQNLSLIRQLDQEIQVAATQIPNEIRDLLMNLQKKKPALSAYLKVRNNLLNQFIRFDRSK